MPFVLRMPALSPTMTAGVLVRWCKNVGDAVKVGDVLADVETDKATMEIEATQAGVLTKIWIEAGPEKTAVGTPLCGFLKPGETLEDLEAALKALGGSEPVAAPVQVSKPCETVSEKISEQKTVEKELVGGATASLLTTPTASPLATRLAMHYKIPLHEVQGTGPNGRIVRADVERFKNRPRKEEPLAHSVEEAPLFSGFEPPFSQEPLSGMRKTVATRLSQSKRTVPHFYLQNTVQVDKLLATRARLNETLGLKVSLNDWVVKAVSAALRAVPAMNVAWDPAGIRSYERVDVAVAVGLENGGLITPVLRDADRQSLKNLSEDMRGLAKKAREGQLTADQYQGGTFTVSNLGMLGVQEFLAILNPPQAGILSVGAVQKTPVVLEDGVSLGVASTMTLGLSVDHRAVDGVPAARFLSAVCAFLNDPERMLML